jgi:DNA invertase Pin-like site-specific DNA recombinase
MAAFFPITQMIGRRKIGFRVLSGQGADIDTTTAGGRLVFGIFTAIAGCHRRGPVVATPASLSRLRRPSFG